MSRNILRRGIVATLTTLFTLISALLGQPAGLDTGPFSKGSSGVPTTQAFIPGVIGKARPNKGTIVNGVGAAQACAGAFNFSTGTPDGRIGTASRPEGPGVEIETADDFILGQPTTINGATFYGLLPTGAPLSSINFVEVELYRVFPKDSTVPPSGMVPTRVNSPSDNAFESRDSGSGNLTFTAMILTNTFAVANTVVNGINKFPNQTTGGEGPATGEEVFFNITFTTPFVLPPDHYFFKPTVGLSSGNFLLLSTTGPPLFTGDLQSWIRNTNLDPDWLRIGTDIVGGVNAPKFNAAFSLSGVLTTCLQDDSDAANVVLFNAQTGEYTFCCGGQVFTGTGVVAARGCSVTIQDFSADRRVLIKFDGGTHTGSAALQSPPGNTRCTIADRNTTNNSCACNK
jgi:hypothetical protein